MMAVKQAVTILAEVARAEALKLTPADLIQAVTDAALRSSTREDVSFHYKLTPADLADVDWLIEMYSQGKRVLTRNDVVRAGIAILRAVTSKTLLPDRGRQAQEAAAKLLELVDDLPKEDCQALRRKLFEN
jgi:hypothetical protein